MAFPIRDNRVSILPNKGAPNSRYYVLNGNGTDVDEYITDLKGTYHKVSPSSSSANSDDVRKSFSAGENINAGRAVMIDTDAKIYLFDITNPYHYDKYIGVSSNAVLSGESCIVIIIGINRTLGPGWVSGRPYYISANGVLCLTAPTVGLVKQVAVGIDPDTIMVKDSSGFEII